MSIRGMLLCVVALGSSSALAAQRPAPASTGRIAGIAPAPTPAPVNPPSNFGPQGPVFFGNIPVIVFADGRVFADFGQGYEQVVRSCTLPVSYGTPVVVNTAPVQPTVIQPIVSQPTIPTSPSLPYTQPVPNQQTASQQMAAQNSQSVQQMTVNTQACWAVGATGRVFVGRP